MTEQQVPAEAKQSKFSVKLLVIIGIILLGAGGVFAYSMWPSSDKMAYFRAEVDTYNFLKEQITDRYENELAWAELTNSKPTESTVKLSAEYNDPYSYGGFSEIEEIINQSSITLYNETDMEEKQMLFDISANVAGITFDDFRIYLSDKVLVMELPFLDEALQIESKDFSKFLHEMDPFTFDPDEEWDFSIIFELDDYPLSEEDKQYIVDEYGKYLYDQLPEEAFSSETEEIEISGDQLKTDKITLHLEEDHLKTIFTNFIEKLQADDRVKDILKDYLKKSFATEYEIKDILDEFDEGLEEALEEIEDTQLSDGIQSVIWVNDGLIVQREFTIVEKDGNNGTETLQIKGVHNFGKEDQTLEYVFKEEDDFDEEEFSITANLSFDGKKIDDQVTIAIDDVEITYQAKETVNNSERDFERSLMFYDTYWEEGATIFWNGQSSYEKDSATSSNRFYIEADEFGGDVLSLFVDVDSKEIRGVEPLEPSNIKDIGKMTEDELSNYIYFDAQEQFFNWAIENFGMPDF